MGGGSYQGAWNSLNITIMLYTKYQINYTKLTFIWYCWEGTITVVYGKGCCIVYQIIGGKGLPDRVHC